MKLITAIELGTNYPENILITSEIQDNNKYAGFCYLTREGRIHKNMLSTKGCFNTKQECMKFFEDLGEECKIKYGDGKVLGNIIK